MCPQLVAGPIVRAQEFLPQCVFGVGDVVFVRMPSTREVRKREKRLFPRRRFWDVFAGEIDALTVHFEHHPALRGFDMPDGSHLDQRDVPAFSKALGEIIVRRLARRAPPGR